VAFVANWGSVKDVRFLSGLLKKNIKVRYSEVPFNVGGNSYNIGSLLITRSGNDKAGNDFDKLVREVASANDVIIQPIASGFMEKGADLGSDKIRFIKQPRIALVGGEETSSTAFGEIWHFFEQQIGYPVSVVRAHDIDRTLSQFDVLIYPDGNYEDISGDRIQNWVQSGGKLIALQNAVAQLAGKKGFALTVKEEEKPDKEKAKISYEDLKVYENREREALPGSIPGAIYKVDLDNTHPLGFGFPKFYYTLKLDNKIYNFLSNGWNVGTIKKNNYVTGFVGSQAKKSLVDGMLFGVQEMGSGSVVYLTEDPLFRSFWENGKLLFSNAVFMVGN
jgi:hypothetical protein